MDKLDKEILCWVGLGLLCFVLMWVFVLISHFTPETNYVITSPPGITPLTYTPKPNTSNGIEVAAAITAGAFGCGALFSFVYAGTKLLSRKK